MMSQKAKKCEGNNQWAGQKAAAKATQYHDKTEFSNEWVSTNKVADCNHPTEKESRGDQEESGCHCSHKH